MHFFKDVYEKCPYTGKTVLITIHADIDSGFNCSIDSTEPEFNCQYQSNCIYAYKEMCWLVQNTCK